MLKVSIEKKFADHHVRKGKEEGKILQREVQFCINGKRIFTPLSTMHILVLCQNTVAVYRVGYSQQTKTTI